MKLYYDKHSKDPTYYAQQGIRNGKKTTTRNVKKFGKHSELLKISNDPESYVRQQIQLMNEEARAGKITFNLTADFNEKVKTTDDEFSATNSLNIGYFILQYIMCGLDLKGFFNEISSDYKNTFDCYTISRFLTYARILDPKSKQATWNHLHTYYEQPLFDYQHILRFMDILEENYTEYLSWLFKKSSSIIPRDTRVLYYDCSNFYFECEQPDEDIVDEVTGEVIKGLRKYGVSKENRPNPIVEMGLLMDGRGIPVSMSLHPGNTNETTTAIPLEKEVLKTMDSANYIYCADAGLGSYNIRKFNSMGGRSFIVTQSIKKLSDVLKEAVFNDFDYHLLSNNDSISIQEMKTFDRFNENNKNLYNDKAYKIITADRVTDLGLYEEQQLKNGKTRKVKSTGLLKQRIIITFSRKVMEYQRTIRSRQIERAQNLLNIKDPEEIKKGPNDIKRFLKRTAETTNEKVIIKYEMDLAKIAEEEKYDGYYAVATNLEDSAKDILAISHKRYQIEECFRIMKTNLSSRPVNHRLPNRITAHFMICYTALLVYRLLEASLEDQNTPITPNNLINTLKNMNVTNIHDIEYMALYKGSKTLDALCQLTNLHLDHQHYKPKDLNKKIKKISK